MPQGAIYSRQELIDQLDIPQIATVVGCGGTGFWTAVFLAMSGVEELVLIDCDIIEISNLNRLLLEERHVGKKKIEVLKEILSGIRKSTRIEIHDMRIEKSPDCQVLRGKIFCCTDNLKSQQLVCAYCKKNDLTYQRIGYDGTILNVSRAFPLSFEETEEQQGYTFTPSWVVPAVLAAAAGVASVLYKHLSLMEDLGKLHIQHSSFVPEKILDEARQEHEDYITDHIDDYLPSGYGYCDDCSHCDDCNRVDPEDHCSDCDKEYTQADLDEKIAEEKEEWLKETIEEIKSGKVSSEELKEALKQWLKAAKRRSKNE
ncbi:MAG: ThiF family adenylyltransferase [Candidatus Velamenicoccus archaeovorus]